MSGADGARRAVAYIRTEVDSEDDQRGVIEAWARREGVEVRSWQLDVGVGGATPIAERPGLLAAYQAISEHRAGVLVAANVERFSRDELVAWLIERAALMQGARLETADGSRVPKRVVSIEDKAYTRGAIDLARAHDRVTHRARIRASLAEKKARGERVGNVPYGYRLASDGRHIEPDEAEQAIIATVRRLASEGLSQRAIVARLGADGATGRTGAPFGQTQVAKLLRS